ncbi:orotidine-5'-phosphate decarboxylase [Cyanobium sp. ATX 6F1]|nr:orotidine-5'-phosphate decarboxylase [Cyanobium sp. ATX 6F1]
MSNPIPDSGSYLSSKIIPPEDRLIVALDVPTAEQAKQLVNDLGETVTFYKLGLELFMASGYFELVDWLVKQKKKVFVDLKFWDIPRTVGSAVRRAHEHGASFVTVHGDDEMLKEAVRERNGVKILAVTMLTSLNQSDLNSFYGIPNSISIEEFVIGRAQRFLEVGVDGVISSGIEAPALRDKFGDSFLIVCPGIRPVENTDDQKRTVDVEKAFQNGADYIVVGRPIREPEKDMIPSEAAKDIQRRISKIFSSQPNSFGYGVS